MFELRLKRGLESDAEHFKFFWTTVKTGGGGLFLHNHISGLLSFLYMDKTAGQCDCTKMKVFKTEQRNRKECPHEDFLAGHEDLCQLLQPSNLSSSRLMMSIEF